MIRRLLKEEADIVMKIWLNANISAHGFIPAKYWEDHYSLVKTAILESEVYVYEKDGIIKGFVGLTGCYIEGLFVMEEFRRQGIGGELLSYIKLLKKELYLSVYSENRDAAAFYKNYGFVVQAEQTDEETGHMELNMVWKQSSIKKALVIGCPGSGKSTFARGLCKKTGLPLYYLDMIWHKPNKTTLSREEFNERLFEILRKDEWIIDGNYNRTLELRLHECDTVYLFDLPVELCLKGAASRIGKPREDLPWVESEFDGEFKRWIEEFPERQLPEIYRLLSLCEKGKNIIIFKTREESENYLKGI